MATYTPAGGADLDFRLLIDPPERQTQQQMSERIVPFSDHSIIDYIGKAVTKIRGTARFNSFNSLKTFEGAVGTHGTLVYSEEPAGIDVIFVNLQRSRVTPADIHLARVEFWITPPSAVGFPAPRQVTVSASATGPVTGSITIDNILSAQVSYGFDQRTGECRISTPIKPACTYDDEITVTMGAGGPRDDGTTAPIVRFVGLIRDFRYQQNPPSVEITAKGYLQRAIEYENFEETTVTAWNGAGGLILPDLVGTLTAHSADVVQAVLTKANVPFSAANVSGSAVLYGGGLNPSAFLWHSGGAAFHTMPMPQEQGETAMSYIERFDAIDAEISGPSTGGRYRTFETVGGDVFRVRVGGRPQADPDFTLVEGRDVLSGNFTRSITQTRNYFVVKGQAAMGNFGANVFVLQESNEFQPATSKHTYQFASDMIERQDNGSTTQQPPTGMSCETLANALALEYNREIVSGYVETWRDDLFGVAQTHLVEGGPGGTIGGLGLAENVWVQSVTISVDDRGFTQRLSYLGGGLPEGVTTDLALLRTHEQLLAARGSA
jgi:hypothetical protein